MIDRSHLISRLRQDAHELELANAEHRPPDRVLIASAVNLMMGAAETIDAMVKSIHNLKLDCLAWEKVIDSVAEEADEK